jgi:hypothetical protein
MVFKRSRSKIGAHPIPLAPTSHFSFLFLAMHTPSLATNVISSREELMAAIATVDELVVRAVRLTRTAQVLTRTAEDVVRTAQDLQGQSSQHSPITNITDIPLLNSATPPPP